MRVAPEPSEGSHDPELTGGENTPMTRSQAFQSALTPAERYRGESDSQYARRIRMQRKMTEHAAKYPAKSDPFAGIPSGDDLKF